MSFDRVFNSSSSLQCEIQPPCNSYNLLEVKAASSSKHVRGGRKLKIKIVLDFHVSFRNTGIQKETKTSLQTTRFWVSFGIGRTGSIGGISERTQEPIEPDLYFISNHCGRILRRNLTTLERAPLKPKQDKLRFLLSAGRRIGS